MSRLRDPQDAEDATQTTFLNAFRSLQRGIDPSLESAWLFKIANQVVLNRRRAASRRRRVETPEDLAGLGESVASVEADADTLIGLPNALSALPEQQRTALLLREWQGLSYDEIARELGVSHAAVETRIFRARKALAERLTKPRSARFGRS